MPSNPSAVAAPVENVAMGAVVLLASGANVALAGFEYALVVTFVVTVAMMLDAAVVEEYEVIVIVSLACSRTFVMVVTG